MLWDVASRNRIAKTPLWVGEGRVSSIAFSPDGKTLAASYFHELDNSLGGGVVLWDVASRNRIDKEPLPVPEGDLWSIAFSSDGETLAAGYTDRAHASGGVVLWQLAGRNRIVKEPLRVPEGDLSSIAFGPDGKTLVAAYVRASGVGGVVLWDLASRSRLAKNPLPGPKGVVKRLAFSPDGKTLAGYYVDVGAVGVVFWDLDSRERLAVDPLPLREGSAMDVALSTDGKTLVTGYSSDKGGGGVVLWDIDLCSWQRIAGRIANRNFTRDEWRQFSPTSPNTARPSATCRFRRKWLRTMPAHRRARRSNGPLSPESESGSELTKAPKLPIKRPHP